jgi:hypothetical protein
MKTQKFKKLALIALAVVAVSAYAQFQDSTHGTDALRGVPVIQQKYLPAQPTPVVNNIYPITRAAPITYVNNSGWVGNGGNSAAASASCNAGDIMLSGGVTCGGGGGLVAVAASIPNGEGWYGVCGDYLERGGIIAYTYVTCASQN